MALNSIHITNQLRPDMTYVVVESIMGKPKSSQIVNEQFISRYILQEMWKGYLPYDLVFNANDQTLITWSENTKAFEVCLAKLKQFFEEPEMQPPPVRGESNPVSRVLLKVIKPWYAILKVPAKVF